METKDRRIADLEDKIRILSRHSTPASTPINSPLTTFHHTVGESKAWKRLPFPPLSHPHSIFPPFGESINSSKIIISPQQWGSSWPDQDSLIKAPGSGSWKCRDPALCSKDVVMAKRQSPVLWCPVCSKTPKSVHPLQMISWLLVFSVCIFPLCILL